MTKKYSDILKDLESAVNDLKVKGIKIEPLNQAIEELKSHSANIEAVENNIDAVRSEVIEPIKGELQQNKKAGRFSILGFYVGMFGLIVTAISLLYTTFKTPKDIISNTRNDSTILQNTSNSYSGIFYGIQNSLNELTYSIYGLNENYIPVSDEIYIDQKQTQIILKSDSNVFSIYAYIPPEEEIGDRYYPVVSLSFLINGKLLGMKGLKEIVTLVNNSGVSYYYPPFNAIWITEKDEFVIFKKHRFKIIRIFRDESQIMTVADDKDAVIIKRMN